MDLPAGYNDPTLQGPTWIMTDRTGKYLYVVNSIGSTVSEYSIDPSTGLLSQLTGSVPIPTGGSPSYGSTDVNGHLFVANTGDNTVSVFSIDNSTGILNAVLQTAGNNFPVPGANSIVNVITDPTGKYLYVLDSTSSAAPATPSSQVFAFSLGSTGVIGSQIGTPQPTGASPNGMAIDPTGALLAIENNIDSTLSLFQITPTGMAGAGGLSAPTTVATDNQPLFVVFYTAAPGQ
jgi:6-phosphogluconolactonase (cycloisomerase 2 family)